MDENSCEGETSEGTENVLEGQRVKKTDDVSQLQDAGIKIDFQDRNVLNQVSERCGSSIDASASGPSTDCTSTKVEAEGETSEAAKKAEPQETVSESPLLPQPNEENASSTVNSTVSTDVEHQESQQISTCAEGQQLSTCAEGQQLSTGAENQQLSSGAEGQQLSSGAEEQQLSTCAEGQQEEETVNVGPPPSYSFVMKQKKKSPKTTLLDPVVIDRPPPPPPTYSGNRGFYMAPEENRLERVCNLPSLAEPLWRSHSQPALCPRCGIIILTTIHSHDSIATHVAALALCLFGCWPCCLLPYCMNICKNTYHHCPICQSFLGAYSPW